MRVLLIAANSETINLAPLPLGAALVNAALRAAGHEVSFLNLMFAADAEDAVVERIREFAPEAVGISVRNIDDQNMDAPRFLLPPVRAVVALCRRLSGAPVVVGGAGYSIFPESALRYLEADFGIRGEGEQAFPALLERVAAGARVDDLSGVYVPGRGCAGRSYCRDLDRLPLPAPGDWIPAGADPGSQWVPVQSRRGCPMDCSFCSTRAIEGHNVRRRSPGAVAEWMGRMADAGFRHFHFVDNTFNLPPSYARDLCSRLIAMDLGLSLWCITYPKWIDGELAELMARAGVREVSLGFESGSQETLRAFNKRFTREEVREISRCLADCGIARRGFLLLGGPGETRDTVEDSLEFAAGLGLDALKITVGLRIYPETPLAAMAAAEGQIAAGDDLLQPRFYLARGMDDWLRERVESYRKDRPWVM